MRQKKERPVLVAIKVCFDFDSTVQRLPSAQVCIKNAIPPDSDIPYCLAFFNLTLSSQKNLWFQNKYLSYF